MIFPLHTGLVKAGMPLIISRQFNIEVQFVKSVNYTFEQSL